MPMNTPNAAPATPTVCQCPSCVEDRARGVRPSSDVWSMPRSLQFFMADEGEKRKLPGVGRLFLGFELEVEFANCRLGRDAMLQRIRKEFLFFKTDGSLRNGVEIVSHPMTYGFLKSQREALSAMLKDMATQGMRGYEPATGGVHIHLAKDAFTTLHLYRFMKLIYDNRRFTTLLSQRTPDKLEQWASLTREGMTDARIKQKAEAKNGNLNGGRYCAVNLQPANTVEMRLFRSTLKPMSFLKCPEFAVAAYEYSKDAALDQLTDTAFKAWITENRDEFPNLFGFLVKKNEVTAPVVLGADGQPVTKPATSRGPRAPVKVKPRTVAAASAETGTEQPAPESTAGGLLVGV